MNTQNRYCCRCHRTTRFHVKDSVFTCTSCGVVIDKAKESEKERSLIGDPFRSFKTSFAT